MDLIGKVAVVVIILVVLFSAVFILLEHTVQSQLTAAQAEQYVLNDLRATNSNANITIISVSNSTLRKGSYNIVLSVVYNATRPCPTLFIEGYDYPATGLVPTQDIVYTEGCTINGLSSAPSYVISSPEIAIVKSYNQNLPQIVNYVDTYSYNNTNVNAAFYATLYSNYTHLAENYSNVWLVHYKAVNANYSIDVVLDSSGAIANSYTTTP